MLNEKDKQLMASKGITEPVIEAQLKRFETGFPWLKLEAAATVGKGIMRLDAKQQSQCIKVWNEFQSGGEVPTRIGRSQPHVQEPVRLHQRGQVGSRE